MEQPLRHCEETLKTVNLIKLRDRAEVNAGGGGAGDCLSENVALFAEFL